MITVIASGRLGKDAEMRDAGGSRVCGFSVAAESGRGRETTWFDCSLWGSRGEKLCQYLRKGSQVTVVGELSWREYNGKQYAQIDVHDIALQGSRDDAPRQQSAPAKPAAQAPPATTGSEPPF